MLRLLALRVLVHVLGRLPARVLFAAADIAGSLAWYASPRLQRTTRDHMRHVLLRDDRDGPAPADARAIDRAARACVRSAARYYADFARTVHLTQQQAFDEVESFEGMDHLYAAIDRGCGVVLLSAHLGSPEYIFRSAGYLGLEFLVLTEALSPPAVHDFVHGVRRAPGVRFVPASGAALRESLRQLRSGGVVAVTGDRDIQQRGMAVAFFGERTRLPTGPLELALRTQASLVPGFVTRTGDGRYRVVFRPALALSRSGDREADVAAGMQAVARALEEGIAAAPEQWFAMEPIWSGLEAAGARVQ